MNDGKSNICCYEKNVPPGPFCAATCNQYKSRAARAFAPLLPPPGPDPVIEEAHRKFDDTGDPVEGTGTHNFKDDLSPFVMQNQKGDL
jgi:hypothetical protein